MEDIADNMFYGKNSRDRVIRGLAEARGNLGVVGKGGLRGALARNARNGVGVGAGLGLLGGLVAARMWKRRHTEGDFNRSMNKKNRELLDGSRKTVDTVRAQSSFDDKTPLFSVLTPSKKTLKTLGITAGIGAGVGGALGANRVRNLSRLAGKSLKAVPSARLIRNGMLRGAGLGAFAGFAGHQINKARK